MNLYYITSPRFTGAVEILYNASGLLTRIEFGKTNMNMLQVSKFKEQIPAVESLLSECFKDVTIVQGTYEISFEEFWIAYGKKINRKRCEPIWQRMNSAVRVAAFMGIKPYDEFLQSQPGRKKLDPENYLKFESWNNEWK